MSGWTLALWMVAAPPAWCERAQDLLAGAPAVSAAADASGVGEALTALTALTALWPARAGAAAERIRALEDGDPSALQRLALARAAVRQACEPTRFADAAALAARARGLMDGDPRFGGQRGGDDAIDRLAHRAWLALARLLETEGMRQYAGSARVVYFVLLLGAVVLVAWRIARASRRQRAAAAPAAATALEARRRRGFASWRARAQAALAAGDARAALGAGQAALLARLGELDDVAVTPARTHREILARLPHALSAIVTRPLHAFDRAWFGGGASLEAARLFLDDVDVAEGQLARPPAVSAIRVEEPGGSGVASGGRTS